MSDQLCAVYSRRDLNLARELHLRLAAVGYTLWLDLEQLMPGTSWRKLLAEGLTSSSAILVIHSWEWAYDRRFAASDLPFFIGVAREVRTRAPVIGLRADYAPIVGPLRTLTWARPYDGETTPELRTPIGTARANRGGTAASLEALETFAREQDEPSRLLRVHLRQHWSDSVTLMAARKYRDVVELWRPSFDTPSFTHTHRRWASEPEMYVRIHSVKSLLFRACGQLSAAEFETYIPLAFGLLRDIVTAPPIEAVTDDELTELDAEAAMTQNLNYADTMEFALEWMNAYEPMFPVFNIRLRESEALLAAASRRLDELRAL